jgi:REP element-mobilizing transposase RayT
LINPVFLIQHYFVVKLPLWEFEMPRKARMLVEGEAAVYHVISRTALDGFVIQDFEKDFLLNLIREMSEVYFAEVLGFCLMGTHFHLVVKFHPESEYTDEEIRARFGKYYQNDSKRVLMKNQIPAFRDKLESLSEFVKEIKQRFSQFYNKRHKRKGFFWSDRYKSVLVEEGETLINLLAYVDLNPVRAGMVERPDDYRWNSLGYHLHSGNKNCFLSLDFGLTGCEKLLPQERLIIYRQFVYEVGGLETSKGKSIDAQIVAEEANKGFTSGKIDFFLARTRYFSDSGIIGSKNFVRNFWQKLKLDDDNPNKTPVLIAGLKGFYSLKRLSMKI